MLPNLMQILRLYGCYAHTRRNLTADCQCFEKYLRNWSTPLSFIACSANASWLLVRLLMLTATSELCCCCFFASFSGYYDLKNLYLTLHTNRYLSFSLQIWVSGGIFMKFRFLGFNLWEGWIQHCWISFQNLLLKNFLLFFPDADSYVWNNWGLDFV